MNIIIYYFMTLHSASPWTHDVTPLVLNPLPLIALPLLSACNEIIYYCTSYFGWPLNEVIIMFYTCHGLRLLWGQAAHAEHI